MKYILVVLALLAQAVHAEEFSSTVLLADCQLVAKSGSVTGALTGGAVGTVAGAAVGGAMFGKWGAALGGLAGGVGGGTYGENMAASKTYSCIIKIQGVTDMIETLGRAYTPGQAVRVLKTQQGYTVR